MADHRPLGESFNEALAAGRLLREAGTAPEFFQSQGLIPQMFLTKNVSQLVNWEDRNEKRLARAAEALLQSNDPLARKLKKVNQVFGREGKDLLFIGRRRERKNILTALRDGRSVLLRGQGGMGKTALALHVAWRKLSADPDGCLPLAFDQTSLSLENICNTLLDFLEVDTHQKSIRTQLAALEKQWDKFFHLLKQVKKQEITPFFIFDNLETFQSNDEPGSALRADIAELLDYFFTQFDYPVLCTGRYSLGGFDARTLAVVDLNEAPLTDFHQKCLHLPALRLLTMEERDFNQIASTLHRSLGGNYRALEFFDELCRQSPAAAPQTLEELDQLLAARTGETLHHIAGDLVFEKLTALLTPIQRRALILLTEFYRRPVLPFAVEWQDASLEPAEPLLERAVDLTLAERRSGESTKHMYYFVPPLVRDLLKANGFAADFFDNERAGAYFEKVQNEFNELNNSDLIEAFFHYEKSHNIEKLNSIGTILGNQYYESSDLLWSLWFAERVENLSGLNTQIEILNLLGLNYRAKRDFTKSIFWFEKALKLAQDKNLLQTECTILNHISHMYLDTGEVKKAQELSENNLSKSQSLGYVKEEIVAYNTLGYIAFSKNEFSNAENYFIKGLNATEKINDKKGASIMLASLSPIAMAQGHLEVAEAYLKRCLAIQQEIGDKKNIGGTFGNLCQLYIQLKQYDLALEYARLDLKSMQEIGDKRGECYALANIGQLYTETGDFENGIEFLSFGLNACKEIGDKKLQGSILHNLSTSFLKKNDITNYIYYESMAWELVIEIEHYYGIFKIGCEFGTFQCQQGNKREGLKKLEMAYSSAQQSNLPETGMLENIINYYS